MTQFFFGEKKNSVCTVPLGPSHLRLDPFVVVLDDLREPEIPQLHDLLAVHQEYVVGFDVAMKNFLLLVQVLHPKAQLYLTLAEMKIKGSRET